MLFVLRFLYLAQEPNDSQCLGDAIFHHSLHLLQPLTVTSCLGSNEKSWQARRGRPTSGRSKGF